MVETLGTPPTNAEQPGASGPNDTMASHTSEDPELRVRKSPVNGKVKDYTRIKNETCKLTVSAHPDDNTLLSDKSLTDMLLSSTPNRTGSSDEIGNTPGKVGKLFSSFEFPQPIDLSVPGPQSHGLLTDDNAGPGCNCDRVPILQAMLVDAQNKIDLLLAEKSSIAAQNDLLLSEIDGYKKSNRVQKAEIKKLTTSNDNLRREISKYKGIRKYVKSSDDFNVDKLTEQLHVAEAKLSSIKDHVISTADALISSLENDHIRINVTQTPDSLRESRPNTASRSPPCDAGARSEPRRRPTVEAPQVPQVLDTRVRTCAAARTQAAPGSSTSSPQVVMIGSSLVRDQGKLLQRQGINCTCYTYSGAVVPFIKSRVPNILTEQCQPEYVHIMCGGNDLDNHNVDEVCQAYERLICEVKRCSPYSTVVVNTIPPRRKNDRKLCEKIRQFNGYLRKKGANTYDESVICFDVYPDFPKFYKSDHVHFSNAGKSLFAQQLANHYYDINFPPLCVNKVKWK